MTRSQNSHWRSLRLLLPALLMLFAIGGAIVLYVFQLRSREAEFESSFETDQMLRAARIQADVDRWVQRNDLEMIQSIFSELGVLTELKAAMFLDATDTVLAATRRDSIGRALELKSLGLDQTDFERAKEAMQTARTKMRGASIFTRDRNGLLVCFPAWLPLQPGDLRVRDGGAILVAYDLRLAKAVGFRHLRAEFLVSCAGILIGAVSLSLCLHFFIIRRLGRLQSAMTAFADGKTFAEPAARFGDEISQLVNQFGDMRVALSKTMKEIQDLYDHAPCGYHSLDASGTFARINDTELAWLGYSRDEVVGKMKFADLLTAESLDIFRQTFVRFKEQGWVRDLDFELIRKDGTILPVTLNATAITDARGNFVLSRSVVHDITERKRAEETQRHLNRELRAISDCNQVLMRAVDERSLLNDVCRVICDEAGYRMAWVGYAENDAAKTLRPVAWAGVDSGYIASAQLSWSADSERGLGPAGCAVRSGKKVYVQDFAAEPRMSPWRERASEHGYRSGLALPLKNEGGSVFGVLLVYSEDVNAITSGEIRLMEELAGDLAFGLTVLRARTESRRKDAINAARLHLMQFAASHSLDDLLEETLNEAEMLTGSRIGFYHFVDDDQVSLTLQNWSTQTKAKFCKATGKGRHYPVSQAGVWVECVQRREPVIHNDYASLPNRKGLPEGHAPVTRELVVPVRRGDKIKAILGVGNKATNYGASDVETVELLADLGWEIAERKRVDDALAASGEKYRTLIEKLQTAVVVHDADTRIISCNPAAQSLLGLTEDQMLGRKAIDPTWHFFREDGSPMPHEEYPVNQVLTTREPLRSQVFGVHRPDRGQDVWVLVNASPVFGTAQAIEEIIVNFVDVTERKQAQERLDHFAAIIACSDDAIIGKALDESIVSWNRGAERIYGYTAAEIVGCPVSILVPPEAQEGLETIMEGVRRGEGVEHLETIRRRKDGQIIQVALTISPLRNARGEIIGASTIARDITERKRAEEEIRELNATLEQRVRERTRELAASEERMRLFFEHKLVGTAITSPEKGWLQVNDKLCEMLGYSREELTQLSWPDLTYPEDLPADEAQFEQLVRGAIDSYTLEKRFVRKDGSLISTELAVGCVRRADRSLEYVLALLEDITERKRAEARIQKLNQELRQRATALEIANQGLESFSYSVSHDLRGPLRSIDGFSRVLLEDYAGKLDDDGKDSLHRIRAASQRMGALIDDLLKLARVSRDEIHHRVVDLSVLAAAVADGLRQASPERRFEFILAPNLTAKGDVRLLQIVLENLFGNAGKFSGAQPVARIEFGRTTYAGEPAFFVRDNGAGFDAASATKLFGAFQRFHTTAEFPGTGIGLATVQRIIQRHGGHVAAESRPGEGATFYFTLPES